VATALYHLELQGRAPQLDYAGINIEVVKALEVDLSRVLEKYRDCLDRGVPAYDEVAGHQQALVDYLKGGKAASIGAMIHLLRKPTADDSELAQSVYEYVISL